MHTAKSFFAECQKKNTRQRRILPCVFVCRVYFIWHSANTVFAECPIKYTRQSLGTRQIAGFRQCMFVGEHLRAFLSALTTLLLVAFACMIFVYMPYLHILNHASAISLFKILLRLFQINVSYLLYLFIICFSELIDSHVLLVYNKFQTEYVQLQS